MSESSNRDAFQDALNAIQSFSPPAELQHALEELRQQGEALLRDNEQLAQKLSEAEQARTKFVSVVTHELRIPMTSIKGYTDLLRTGMVGPLNEQQSSFVNVIRSNVERMSALVSDLSDLSHIETGRLKVAPTRQQVSPCLENLLLTFQPRFDEKKQVFQKDIPADLPVIMVDPARLTQVLAALLNNAYLYTPEGGAITLRAGESAGRVRLEVSDTGIGIAEGDRPQIFTPFFRSEDPGVREHPGWGLNLALAKKLVELMGGEIGFDCEGHAGTTFFVILPEAA